MTLAGRPPTPPRNGLYPDDWFKRGARLRLRSRQSATDVLAALLVLLVVAALVLLLLALVAGLAYLTLTLLMAVLRHFGG